MAPWAFVNWILFDEQFKFVQSSSGAEQVRTSENFLPHVLNDLPITKNGYLYVYVSNETANIDVFFDNLQVTHDRGPILEETHYYPFGLTMNGISSKGLNVGGNDAGCGCPNKKGFNGNEIQQKEFSDGSGLEVYDFNARTYDQQIGRFIQIDPLTEEGNQESLTPYQFGFNNPVRYEDADGRCPGCVIWAIRLLRAYRAYRTAKVLVNSTTAANSLTNQYVMTSMIITTDAKGKTVSIPENKLKEFEAQVKTEKVNDLQGKAEKLDGDIKSLERTTRSLDKNVEEHKQKLEDYKNDPDKYDNKGELQGVSPEMRQQRIDGRINSLEKQIKKNQGELDKAKGQIQLKKDELQNVNQEIKKMK